MTPEAENVRPPVRFCLGFLFSHDDKSVWLIRKQRPKWQEGFLNGIGGHVQTNESFLEAMAREGFEEAGVKPQWGHFLTIKQWCMYFNVSPNWECGMCVARLAKSDPKPTSKTPETLVKLSMQDMAFRRTDMLPDVPMYIHIAATWLQSPRAPFHMEVTPSSSSQTLFT